MPQQPASEYLAHGQTPFFRLPCADPRALPAGTRAVVLGVPTDAGTTYQPGARLAPWHVRRVSALVQGWHVRHALDPFRVTGAVDGGNVAFPPFDRDAGRAAIEATVAAILAQGAAPFLVGGDHAIALPALRAAARAHGPLTVVHVDAHLDTSGPETWGDAWHHGTPIRHALDEGLVADGQLWQLGVRGPWSSPEDGAPGDRHGARRVDADALAVGVAEVAREIRAAAGTRPAWITFDVDAVDPAFAPGTGTPVPGGLTSREALALVRALAGIRLVGMDVVEVCPPLDHADITSHLAAHLVYEGLALVAVAAPRRGDPGAPAGARPTIDRPPPAPHTRPSTREVTMGAEARLFLIPEPASFRPDPPALARLVAALRRERWVADPAEPWFSGMRFDSRTTDAHAAATGAFVRRLGAPGAAGAYEPLPAGDLEAFFGAIAREERRVTWPVCGLGGTPLRFPLGAASPVGRDDAYYDLELWLADDYVYVTSEIVDPFDDEACGACGAPLALDVEPRGESLFRAARLRRRCARCGEPFEASSRTAVVRDPFSGDEQDVPGGATFRFALVVDCGKCFPDSSFGPHQELLALCETELGSPLRSVVDVY